jgi:hypothetical protein
MSVLEKLSEFIVMIFAIAVLLHLGAYGVKILWNFLIPDVFNGPELTYPQAFVGYCLTKLIFPFNIDFKKLIE